MPSSARPRLIPLALAAALATLLPAGARAHGTGLSYLDLVVEGRRVEAALDLPAQDLARALFVDANRDGLIGRDDVERSQEALSRWLAASLRLVAGGGVCEASFAPSELRDDALVTVRARYACPGEVDRLELSSRLLDTLGRDHSTFVHARRGAVEAQALLNADDTAASLELVRATAGGTFVKFLELGVEHIFTGVDHVCFLLALLLLGGSLGRVIGIATAFTAAHSVTLSLAALGALALPSRFVESAIAASIAWVAVEDWRHASPRADGAPEPLVLRLRWVTTFVFGLVHGFGFASVLSDLGLPQEHLFVSLAAFNLGVEAGQVAIIAALWPLLTRAARQPWYRPAGIRAASLVLFALGVYWFVGRAFT